MTSTGKTLWREDSASDKRFRGRTGGKAALETDSDQGTGELTRDDGGVGEKDGATDEVGEGRAGRGGQERGEHSAGTLETLALEDGAEGEAAKVVRCLWKGS